jgi:ribonucleotide monophosphatase NagD (HAD superfamily)
MIGDAWSDVQAGQAAGVRQTILVKTGRGKDQLLQPRPETISSHLIFEDLSQAIDAICASDKLQAFDAEI